MPPKRRKEDYEQFYFIETNNNEYRCVLCQFVSHNKNLKTQHLERHYNTHNSIEISEKVKLLTEAKLNLSNNSISDNSIDDSIDETNQTSFWFNIFV